MKQLAVERQISFSPTAMLFRSLSLSLTALGSDVGAPFKCHPLPPHPKKGFALSLPLSSFSFLPEGRKADFLISFHILSPQAGAFRTWWGCPKGKKKDEDPDTKKIGEGPSLLQKTVDNGESAKLLN